MPAPTLNITELDYDQILTNLVAFMKTDTAFADYDFSGSGLRLLARVLAYVVFYQNYYLTAAVNESFLDTAQLRSSVASHARMLGYNLRGTTSARFSANVQVALTSSSAQTITLPKQTQFTLQANNAFTFYSLSDTELTVNNTSGLYETSELELVEGRPLQYRFTVDLTNPSQRFVLPNANVDYTTVSVTVQDSVNSNTTTQFSRAGDLLTIGPTDPVFFVQEAYDGLAELKFGNGVVGLPLVQGNVIIVSYYVSRGEDANNLRGPFVVTSANVAGFVSGTTVADVNTLPSLGGENIEDLDSARFLAPLTYQAQNRCVTAEDYKTAILTAYGSAIGAINVFGGEQGDPTDPKNRPIFGRVFVALKPATGLRFTDIVRQNIEQNVLKPRSIVGVIPQVIDPEYIYFNVSTSVRYDPKATSLTKSQLQANIKDNILSFTLKNVEKFDKSFRFSKFVRVIDDTDEAIVGSVTRIDLEQRLFPVLSSANQYVLKFNVPLRKNSDGSVIMEATNHRFTYTNVGGVSQENCFFFEQNGTISIAYRGADGQIAIHQSNVGNADAASGLVTITNFAPTAIENGDIDVRVRVVPAVNDFTPRLNQLFTIDDISGVSVQLLNDATATPADTANFFIGGILP
jgi:hypothetical protein